MSSSWIVTATTLFRLMAVKFPFKSRYIINTRVTYYTLICIYSFGLLSIIPIYKSLEVENQCIKGTKIVYEAIQMKASIFLLKIYTPGRKLLNNNQQEFCLIMSN